MRIDPTLYRGRPAQKRSEVEEACYDLLDGLGVAYERADHEHGDTIEALREVESLLGCEICKNLLLTNRQMTELYLLLMPGEKPFKTRILSKEIGTARLSFAAPEQMLASLGVTPGSVSPLGLMNDREKRVHLLIDRDLLSQAYVGVHPCMNTSTLKIAWDDLLHTVFPALGVTPRFVELPWDPDNET